MEVLLEVVAQRDIYERTLVGDELHRGRESALDDRQVARCERPREIVHVAAHLHAFDRLELAGVDARSAHQEHPRVGH